MDNLTPKQEQKLHRVKLMIALKSYVETLDYKEFSEEGILASVMLQSFFNADLRKDAAEMIGLAVFKNSMSFFDEEACNDYLDKYNDLKDTAHQSLVNDLKKYSKDA